MKFSFPLYLQLQPLPLQLKVNCEDCLTTQVIWSLPCSNRYECLEFQTSYLISIFIPRLKSARLSVFPNFSCALSCAATCIFFCSIFYSGLHHMLVFYLLRYLTASDKNCPLNYFHKNREWIVASIVLSVFRVSLFSNRPIMATSRLFTSLTDSLYFIDDTLYRFLTSSL